MTEETNSESSPSLASLHAAASDTVTLTVEELWVWVRCRNTGQVMRLPECKASRMPGMEIISDAAPLPTAEEDELTSRAVAAADALLRSGWINESASQAAPEEIAAEIAIILRPFLSPAP